MRNLEGKHFGRLTVIRTVGVRKTRMWWLCICNCEKEIEVSSNHLCQGHTQSCGCLKRKKLCRKGHSISGENVYLSKNQPPRCKICKLKCDEVQSKVAKKHPERNRLATRRYRAKKPQQCLVWRYGITFEQKKKMEEMQDGKCAICRKLMDRPCIDHDHETKQVRDLLCGPCNSALGFIRENIQTAENLVIYLKKWKTNATPISDFTLL